MTNTDVMCGFARVVAFPVLCVVIFWAGYLEGKRG